MSRWPANLAILILLGGITFLVFETKRSAEALGEAELAAAAAKESAATARQELADYQAARADDATPKTPAKPAAEPVALSDYTRLQVELHTTRQQLEAVRKLLDERNAELERRVKAAAAASKSALQPMPEGVRVCLQTLHDCLRLEGYTTQKFLRAMAVDEEGLHDVEMLESSANGLSVTFYNAGRMTAQIDRATGVLDLRFFDGHRTVNGERAAFPEEGFSMTFKEIDGRLFERRLPYLVKAEGTYPVAEATPKRPATDLDPGTRRQWLTRMEKVVDRAKTDINWRVSRVRGLQGATFLKVELVGTNDKNLVVASAHCDKLAFEIDERSGLVSLLLNDGVLRQDGVESTITGEGYRMLLPGVTPKETIDAMLGMIVKK